ncbi:hypothetical protein Bca52824_082166 [Brassica carinata]|uniref:Secreted protein n=1 Tax=Brassica carinata TaxID=52824 RepID=A0A8X7TRN7_BRACI|nr:hypothetical protein Bca52824_082166 [Brassica carinata]
MKISRCISFLLMVMIRGLAKFMAIRTAKASARRGYETCCEVAECWDEETRSSMIQPNHAAHVVEFQAASV